MLQHNIWKNYPFSNVLGFHICHKTIVDPQFPDQHERILEAVALHLTRKKAEQSENNDSLDPSENGGCRANCGPKCYRDRQEDTETHNLTKAETSTETSTMTEKPKL